MRDAQNTGIDLQQAKSFLASYYGAEPAAVALVGAGAWSRCFGFRWRGEELVIRFGRYVDDFHNDQLAYRYASPDLPIPRVLAIGHAFDGYYAISTRVYGEPLEQLAPDRWRAVLPSLVAALEALRLADLAAPTGIGGWGGDGQAPYSSWSQFLLTVGDDTPDQRTYGWRERLATSPEGEAAFRWGFDLLTQVASDSVPRCLVHNDLTNRNVLVATAQTTRISGVFDWGCSIYGDHLYDLAWFEFWAPWHPNLDVPALRTALEQRWREVGYAPAEKEARLTACYLHIGLIHLAYNAYLGDWATLLATAERMRLLAQSGGRVP